MSQGLNVLLSQVDDDVDVVRVMPYRVAANAPMTM